MNETNEMRGLRNIAKIDDSLKEPWIVGDPFKQAFHDEMMRNLGYIKPEGLSFYVRPDRPFGSIGDMNRKGRVYDHPLTKRDQRRYDWAKRRARWSWKVRRPFKIARWRLRDAWQVLKGADDEW